MVLVNTSNGAYLFVGILFDEQAQCCVVVAPRVHVTAGIQMVDISYDPGVRSHRRAYPTHKHPAFNLENILEIVRISRIIINMINYSCVRTVQ